MRTSKTIDASPPINRWMKDKLDRDAFKKTIQVMAARVPASKTGQMLKAEELRGSIIDLPKIRSVLPDPSDPGPSRLLLLGVTDEADLSPKARYYLKEQSAPLLTHSVELNYDYWTAEEILHSILPEELCEGAPTGFAVVGHVAHLNLNDQYLPYKYLIGQIILDKNKTVRTVVNKLDQIHNQFRFFKMELVAGESNYVVEHHESNCRFTFDFSQVYWNSRLHTEHDRMVQSFKAEDEVADVFAGVGPFALPAAKKGCAVWANDLNPISHKYLVKNIEDNKVGHFVRASCEDGRDFIRAVVARALDNPLPPYTGPKPSRSKAKGVRHNRIDLSAQDASPAPPVPPRSRISHFVMNLPDSATTFLDAFRGLLSSENVGPGRNLSGIYDTMPMVHCYCFTKELELDKAEADIRKRVEEKIGHALDENAEVSLHLVRSVAPNKDMYCISFRLPPEVAFA